MTEPILTTERSPDGYAVLTLNRPGAMNALSSALRRALADTIDELQADPAVRVLILTGAGRAFSAGLDLKELGVSGLSSTRNGAGDMQEAVQVGDPVRALARFTGPVTCTNSLTVGSTNVGTTLASLTSLVATLQAQVAVLQAQVEALQSGQ